MKTRTVVSTVYEFDELSDRAKDKARDWFRESVSHDFNDWSAGDVIEDCARLLDMIGLNIRTRTAKLMGGGTRQEPQVYYSGFSSQGDGASYVGSYRYKRGSVRVLAAEAPTGTGKGHDGNNEINRIARELFEVQRRNFYQVQANVSSTGRYFHLDIDVERADEKDLAHADDHDLVTELLRDVASWIYRQLEREYEYRLSAECVDEDIRSNEYEFDEDGHRA